MADPLLLGIEIGGTETPDRSRPRETGFSSVSKGDASIRRAAAGIRAQIVEATVILMEQWGVTPSDVAGLGIGFGGPVEPDRGVITVSNQIDGWAGFPIVAWGRESVGISRVTVQNDADAATLGEARFGAGAGFSPVLYVNIGSGIGGGLAIDGSLYRASGRGAVEIGHLLISDAPACTLEQIASGWSIARRARLQRPEPSQPLFRLSDGDPSRITAELVDRARRGGG